MNTTTQIPATQNDAWGFWGTMNEHASAAWPLAMTAISDATSQPLESVRVFLDSRHGRHFADDVQNGLYEGKAMVDAINAATGRWMGWTIGRQTSKQYGIPRGLPYLTGFVIHCEIVEESLADRMPEPINTDPSYYLCKFCPAYGVVCHRENDWSKHLHVNCRTCAHSTAKEDSTWRCERHDADGIPVDFQRTGCDSHVLHPDLVPWPRKDGLDEWTAVYVIEGRDVANGEGDAHVYPSREILANPTACSLGDEYIEKMREQFGGRIVG